MNAQAATISVVTISFNQASFLGTCVESVSAQQGPKEHILVDAESTDQSPAVIERYAAGLSEIIVERDEGPADGLNKGFSRAKGDILCYLNADDCFVPGAFEHVRAFFD